ncbi:protein of unknown function [Hyphomicrobium sp. 1Nfss2.1]|uniref:hypothetical protein n=1 Tax=Hyphomicrobium sp. 1Nfss2.1 TaxID=3413936 RepID=UPI003C7EC7BF
MGECRSGAVEGRHEHVFVHSSFRTSSTWFWLALRRSPNVCAYYEVFHTMLADLEPGDLQRHRYDSWPSGHPAGDPYFVEYAPLLGDKGVSGYFEDMAFDRFIPEGGLAGALSVPEIQYLGRLIAVARDAGSLPILTACRSLGRIGAIKRQFGGWNIFLYRNLFQQWMSYLGRYRGGNGGFFSTIEQTLSRSRHDPFMARLAKECLHDEGNAGTLKDVDAAFRAFMSVHLYLSINAFREAEQVVDVNRLVSDEDYRAETVDVIERATGLCVDFGDGRERIESAGLQRHAPSNPGDVVEGLLETVAEHLQLGAADPAYQFGVRLAKDCLEEEARYRFYTDGLKAEQQARQRALEDSRSWKVAQSLRALCRWQPSLASLVGRR